MWRAQRALDDRRDSLDFDQQVGPDQSRDLYERARRRRARIDVLVTHRPDDRQLIDADDVEGELDNVMPAGTSCRERSTDILECQPRLSFASARDAAVGGDTDLPRGPDKPTGR